MAAQTERNLVEFEGRLSTKAVIQTFRNVPVEKVAIGQNQTFKLAVRRASRTPAERRSAMRWAQRSKRVIGIDVESCAGCGGAMRIIACIEDPAVIKAIHAHLAGKARPVHAPRLPPGRAPPASAFS